MRRVGLAIQSNHFDYAQLQLLIEAGYLIINAQHVFHRAGHRAVRKEDKSVAFATRVALRHKEGLYEFWGVGYEVLKCAIDGVDGEDGVFADVGVSVFEAGAA